MEPKMNTPEKHAIKKSLSNIAVFFKKYKWIVVTVTLALNIGFNIKLGVDVSRVIRHETVKEEKTINTDETFRERSSIIRDETNVVHNTSINSTEENKKINLSVRSYSITEDDKRILVNYMNEYLIEKTKNINYYSDILKKLYEKKINENDTDILSSTNRLISDFESKKTYEEIDREYMQHNLLFFFNNDNG